MKKKILYLFSIFLVVFLCISITNNKVKDDTNNTNITTNTYDETSWWTKKPTKYNIDNMSLEEKIAQMLIITNNKKEYDEEFKNFIKESQPGGFILMGENISTYENTLSLVRNIKKDSKISPFIAIDEEGGRVQRLKKLKDIKITDIPSMYDLGKTNDADLSYQIGKILAYQVRTLEVNLNFAPVLDVYNNKENKVIGDRSFSSNPNIVSKMSLNMQKSLEENYVMPVVKHFPGHGDTEVDSHYDTPIINKTYDELLNNELMPFITSIENNVKMIMIGHIALPKITNSNIPASISRVVINDILKEKLNYNGIIITDALNMKGITNNYTEEEICALAVTSGVDILLSPTNPKKCIESIKEKVISKEIPVERINESVKKILLYKELFITDNYLDKSYLNKKEYNDILKKVS